MNNDSKQAPFINGTQFHADSAHGPYENHMDMRQNLSPELQGMNLKMRIDTTGNVMTQDLEVGKKFIDNLYR